MKRVLIIGGGAAGMAAAVFAARSGVCQVEVFEKNEKLGKKLFITGKGRCNVTNACDTEELFTSVRSNPKFLYSAFYGFTNQDAMQFFEDLGVPLKVERGNRVFPVSDHSSDIIRGLENEMKRLNVQIHLRAEVADIIICLLYTSRRAHHPRQSSPAQRPYRRCIPSHSSAHRP